MSSPAEAEAVQGDGAIDLAGAEGGCDADSVAKATMSKTHTIG
ncbi:hypothetical protein ACIF6H_36575 [Streptomyces microflavus]